MTVLSKPVAIKRIKRNLVYGIILGIILTAIKFRGKIRNQIDRFAVLPVHSYIDTETKIKCSIENNTAKKMEREIVLH